MKASHGTLAAVAVVLLGALLIGSAGSGAQPAAPAPESAVRDGVFVHVRSGPEDPHAVLMALQMANLMAEGRDVAVYFDLKGVDVVMKDAKEITFATFEPAQQQIKRLVEKKVPLYVRPGCLKALNKKAEDVVAGVKIAEKDAFFAFTKGRILTLDY